MKKIRLDIALVNRGLAENRTQALGLIMAGRVSSGNMVLSKAGLLVAPDRELRVKTPDIQYVSRGGMKLAAALDRFSISIHNLITMDVGASTGGFTDVLLQRGAQRVYAVDVGYGQLAWTLRQNPRVVVMERTNIRYLTELPETPELATIDVSFISLDKVIPAVQRLLSAESQIIALIKPQFEAGRNQVGKGGVVRSTAVHQQVLTNVTGYIKSEGWTVSGIIASPLLGPAGNREFLAWFDRRTSAATCDVDAAIQTALAEAIEVSNARDAGSETPTDNSLCASTTDPAMGDSPVSMQIADEGVTTKE